MGDLPHHDSERTARGTRCTQPDARVHRIFLCLPPCCLPCDPQPSPSIFRKMNHGLLVFIQHIPPLSLIPLLVLWFGIGETPKFLIIILATFFPIYLNMEDGLLRADPKLLEVGKTLGFSQRETLWKIRLPLALPTIVTGMRIGMGYSLRSIIGAEMIAADRGLGYFILDAQTMSRSDKVIVGILAIGLIGFFLDGLFSLFSYVLFPYERRNS